MIELANFPLSLIFAASLVLILTASEIGHQLGRRVMSDSLADSGQHLRAANEHARIDAKSPADQAEYHNCADADAASTTRSQPATIFNATACR